MSEQRIWRIGELAKRAGITVRTLHHYHRLGLLSPSCRTSGGHRCYTSKDVVRLQGIIALRSYGLSLKEIGVVLSGGAGGLADLLRRQLEVAGERIRQAAALRLRLLRILDALDRRVEPPITEILQLMEETTALNHPFTTEQLAKMREQRARQVREMSAGTFAAFQKKLRQSWAALGRDEQALLAEQRRAMLSAGGGARR